MKHIFLALLIMVSFQTFAQDTTWVQTFTFDSIATRRAEFQFPQELNDKRFERILMYYKLKCDPQTPWDSYDCGEWDYLAYTRLFEHTGDFDSTEYTHPSMLVNGVEQPDVYLSNTPVYNVTTSNQNLMVVDNINSETESIVGLGAITGELPFSAGENQGRSQFVITAGELTAAGLVAGDIHSLSLNTTYAGGLLAHLKFKMKSTVSNTLTEFDNSGAWNELYYYNTTIATGDNKLHFLNPFNWDGISNILVEVTYENAEAQAAFDLTGDIVSNDISYTTQTRDGVASFDGIDDHINVSDFSMDFSNGFTFQTWVKFNSYTNYSRIMDFGNGPGSENILIANVALTSDLLFFVNKDGVDQSITVTNPNPLGEWLHIAWTIDNNDNAKIYLNGVLAASGVIHLPNSNDRTNNYLGKSNWDNDGFLDAQLNETTLWNAVLTETEIQDWMNKKVSVAHPNFSNLALALQYDNGDDMTQVNVTDVTSNVMSALKVGGVQIELIESEELYLDGLSSDFRPQIKFYQGDYTTHIETASVNDSTVTPGTSVVFYQVNGNSVEISSSDYGWEVTDGSEDSHYTTSILTYYGVPFEVINDIEIGRFITPYGINFDLGADGFTWIYDVTDYVHYLKNTVDLAAHNTQELIDLKFAFIEGIPPRDVHHRQPIWNDWKSYSYANLDNDVNLSAVSIPLADSSSTFKIKSRMTGHGHNGNTNCCEWDPKDHYIKIDGVDRFVWDVWEETACGDNPNPGQGGTWPYAREGWCPGDMVKEYDHEITPFVTPGTNVTIDYDIEDVPVNDQAQGAGNYVMAMDLISYSAPNFQHDAAIAEVLNPNNYEYYRKWNPSCQNPRIIIQNTGEQPLTECTIKIYVSYGNPILYTWTGNLAFLEKEIVEIPVTNDDFWGDYFGLSQFTAEIVNLGAHPDEYVSNSKRTVQFDAPKSIEGKFLVWFNTNNRANENKWRLEDSEGNLIFQRTSLTNSSSYQDTFDLAPGCYSIILEDSDSDGLGYWYSNQAEGETNGTFRLKKVGGPNVEVFPRDFGNFHRFNFSVGFTLGQENLEFDGEIGLYPNPNDGSFFVECLGLTDNNSIVEVRDMMGRVLLTKTLDVNDGFASSHINLGDVPAGNYFVVVKSEKGVFTKKMVKTK